MKTESVFQSLKNEVEKPSNTIILEKEEVNLILNRVNYLESVAAALLKGCMESGTAKQLSLPYRKNQT